MEPIDTSRRDLLVNTALITGAALLAGPVSAANADTTAAISSTRQQFAHYFRSLGYTQVKPKSLITGEAAHCQGSLPGDAHAWLSTNGGLRYDEEIEAVTGPQFVFQGAARIDDIPKKGLPNVLPYFTIMSADTNSLVSKGDMIDLFLNFLIHTAGLSPRRLSVTSTELVIPYLGQLAAFGIAGSQVTIRNLDAAMVAGQGSGWLRNPVTGFSQPSLSLEYRRGNQVQEIGEICLREASQSDSFTEGGGLGLERLIWAQTGRMPGWNERLADLLADLRSEAHVTGQPLPVGFELFAGTA